MWLLAVLLTVALFVLKLIHVITLSWLAVFSPMLIVIAFYVVLFLALAGAAILVAIKTGAI